MKSIAEKNGSRPTIIDVAEAAGVSMKTVSRVINGEISVRTDTRERVLGAIKQLGYQRNVFARGLRADRSHVLGLLYENPQGDYPADVLHGALAYCRAQGFHLVVEVLQGEDMGAQTSRFLSQMRMDGLFMTPPVCDNADVLRAINDFNVPYVRISPNNPEPEERYIAIDDFKAAKEVVCFFIALGHRRIGLIKGMPDHAATRARLEGYKAGLSDAGIPFDDNLVVEGNFDFQSGYDGTQILLRQAEQPTAIFACNDEAAAGSLSFAHHKGIKVPEELSVSGFDGGTISQVVWPRLTTVQQPIRDLGEAAVRLLIDDENSDEPGSGAVILGYQLIIGKSTAACK